MDHSFTARLRDPFISTRGKRRRRAKHGRARGVWLTLSRHRWLRRLAIAVAIALPVLGGGWLWLRGSALVRVEHVRISGVHGVEARAIERALRGAAKHMSTMEMNPAALRAAVASYPQVREVHASASFPHSARILVTEQLPVATLLVGDQKTALAADGAVLGGSFVSPSLPLIEGTQFPSGHVSEARVEQYLQILGAAPAPLRKYLARVYMSDKGITVQVHGGMLIYFGDTTRPHAKWLSFARVLTQESAAGAAYIDVRLPERPAAGMPGATAAQHGTQIDGLDPTSAALTESLASAVNGENPQPSSPATTTTATANPTETEAQPQEQNTTVSEESASQQP